MVLETEFGYREVNEVAVIDRQPPLRQEVERRHRPGHTRTEISPDALSHLFAMEASGQQRDDRLYQVKLRRSIELLAGNLSDTGIQIVTSRTPNLAGD
jgi:hypothetical protein